MMQKQRRTNTLRLNPKIYLVCEGETEVYYFSGLKSSLPQRAQREILTVKQATKTSCDIVLVDAIQIKAAFTHQLHVYAVFDHDNQGEKLHQAMDSAQKNQVKVAFSNPCFEYWLSLHLKDRHPKIDCDSFGKSVEDETNIKKPYQEFWSTFGEHIQKARERAKRRTNLILEELKAKPKAVWELRPYTNVQDLIEEIFLKTGFTPS